jgi:pSer/pThr/pTyr-binding forkhead associated (FHA) protein|tara:strand:- start:979 stop:1623 length:645 start_codon:yes stop_codon:yes gene_type:complete
MSNMNYKTCEENHFYSSSLSQCPHCDNKIADEFSDPQNQLPPQLPGEIDDDKTEIMPGSTSKPIPEDDSSNGSKSKISPVRATQEPDKTQIYIPESKEDSSKEQRKSRNKLVGWLVSYTISNLGVDFRIFEGQNVIGRDQKSTVCISEDSGVSSKHATLLVRGGKFYLKDEMSTNPSYVNNVEVMPGSSKELKDGDKIRISKTELLLRTATILD